MNPIIIKHRSDSGIPLEATFLPDQGMNLISYKLGDLEVIDSSTRHLFEERFAGLGALIGPHFHHRKVIPPVKDESLFPHIARVKAKGIAEPFSHGIARYAPWKAEYNETKVKAILTGKDLWNGVPLADLEGQNFTINFEAEMGPSGLHLKLSVVSDTDSLIGIHYYYRLPEGKGKVISQIQNFYLQEGKRHPLKQEWKIDAQQKAEFDMTSPIDTTFYPFPNPLESKITLDTQEYKLVTTYNCRSQENCWQLYHPQGASFVCIEPLSAQDPRHPNLTVSSLDINLEIFDERNK